MNSDKSSNLETTPKDLAIALAIFTAIIVLSILLAWRFNPSHLIFSESFENAERNQQYLPCAAFTIVDEKLRVTVAEPHSGCAVRLPNEYDDFTFTATVFPVGDVYDGSVNILLRQGYGGWYEIQFRPKAQQFKFISFAVDSNGNPYIDTTTDWQSDTSMVFKNSENKIKVTMTKQWMGFWFNDELIFTASCVTKFPFDHGIISIGARAGDVGNIAFEFDDLEIREEKLFSRWWHDFLVIQESRNSGK